MLARRPECAGGRRTRSRTLAWHMCLTIIAATFVASLPATANEPPVAYIDSIAPNPTTKVEPVYFEGRGTDDNDTIAAYEWRSSRDGLLRNDQSFSTNALSFGNHTIAFRVQDDEGAWSEWVNQSLRVNLRPTVSIEEIFPSISTEGTMVRFKGIAADPDGGRIVAWEWKSDLDGWLGGAESIAVNNLSRGYHNIDLRAQDDDGAWSRPVWVVVTVEIAPPEPEEVDVIIWLFVAAAVLLTVTGIALHIERSRR